MSQLWGNGDGYSWIMWFVFMFFLIYFYPKLMISQIMWKLEKTAENLESMSRKSKKFIINRITKKPTKSLKESIDRFFEFFVIEPVSLDPYGIIRKLDHIIQNEKQRFDYFVKQIAPKMDEERRASLTMGLSGGISLHMIAKIIRHYVELIRKTKNLQIAMLLQMQLPMIEKLANAVYEGTRALTKGEPIGDSVGPYIVAKLIGNAKTKEIEEDVVMAEKKMLGRHVFLLKAKGPGGRLGRPGKAVEKLLKKHKIAKIITIDAAAKLEGEKTGSIAEGVGVAIGGPGVEKSYIENVAVKKTIPLDSIIVKMSAEEAIMPMRKEIKDAFKEVEESIKRSLIATKPKSKVIIVGVGNTSGIGNSSKGIEKTEKWIEQYSKKLKEKEKKKKKRFF